MQLAACYDLCDVINGQPLNYTYNFMDNATSGTHIEFSVTFATALVLHNERNSFQRLSLLFTLKSGSYRSFPLTLV